MTNFESNANAGSLDNCKESNCLDSKTLISDYTNEKEQTIVTCNSIETISQTPDNVAISTLNDNAKNSTAMFDVKMATNVKKCAKMACAKSKTVIDNSTDIISIGSSDSSDEENVKSSRPACTKKVTRRGLNLLEFCCTSPACEIEYPKSAIYSSRILAFSEQKRTVNQCLDSLDPSQLSDDDGEDNMSVPVETKQVNNDFSQEENTGSAMSDDMLVVKAVSNKKRNSPSPPPKLHRVVKKVTKKTRKLLDGIEKNKLLYDASKLLYTSDLPVSPEKELLDTNSTRTILAKFRWQGSIFKIAMKRNEKFLSILPEVAKRCQARLSDILLARNEETIEIEESPNSIDLSSADIIDCYSLNSASIDQNSITLFIQASDSKTKIPISVNKLSPLSEMMAEYAKQRNLPLSNMKFRFDGDILEPTDTPVELDMQNENCIDVVVSR